MNRLLIQRQVASAVAFDYRHNEVATLLECMMDSDDSSERNQLFEEMSEPFAQDITIPLQTRPKPPQFPGQPKRNWMRRRRY